MVIVSWQGLSSLNAELAELQENEREKKELEVKRLRDSQQALQDWEKGVGHHRFLFKQAMVSSESW